MTKVSDLHKIDNLLDRRRELNAALAYVRAPNGGRYGDKRYVSLKIISTDCIIDNDSPLFATVIAVFQQELDTIEQRLVDLGMVLDDTDMKAETVQA